MARLRPSGEKTPQLSPSESFGGEVRGLSAEHGGIDLDPAIDHGLALGDRVWFVPRSIAGCVNLHDYMHVIRNGKLDAVWELPARGRYR